eukprot:COSAG02_NODE_727_length_18004_cov_7.262161_2_plen_137_part_00
MSGRRDTMLESEVVVCFCPRLVALPASILAAVMAVSSAADVINAISSIRSVERVAAGTEHTASAVGERRQPPPSFSGSGSSSVAIVFDVSTDGHAHRMYAYVRAILSDATRRARRRRIAARADAARRHTCTSTYYM